MNHISKEIYHQEGISKRFRPLSIWWWVLTLIGALCAFLYLTRSQSALLLGGMFLGGFCLLIIICYLLFGDNRAPYHKPSKHTLVLETNYYSKQVRQQLLDALEERNFDALQKIKKNVQPELILARYSDDAETVFYYQLLELQGDKEIPLTEVIKQN